MAKMTGTDKWAIVVTADGDGTIAGGAGSGGRYIADAMGASS
jgi:hypothetical protein